MENKKQLIDRRAAFIGSLLGNRGFEEMDPELTEWAVEQGLGAMCYYRFHDRLTGKALEICRNQYRFGAMQDLKFTAAFAEIQKIFESAGIDYIPLKGMALIRQKIYSDGALRLHCDMDILLRSESECRRAAELLIENGWKSPGKHEFFQHIPALSKIKSVELHHHLPGVDDEEKINRFWADIAYNTAGHEYNFPAEFHFALAVAHCGNHHDWEYGAKFLLDAGLLSKVSGFDWQRCFKYCHDFGIGKPEVLLDAFGEIFGKDGHNSESCDVLRSRILGDFVPYTALIVTAEDRFSLAWFRKYLERLSLSWLRNRYTADNTPWYKMLGIIWRDYTSKFKKVCCYLFAHKKAAERKNSSAVCREILGFTVNPNEL